MEPEPENSGSNSGDEDEDLELSMRDSERRMIEEEFLKEDIAQLISTKQQATADNAAAATIKSHSNQGKAAVASHKAE